MYFRLLFRFADAIKTSIALSKQCKQNDSTFRLNHELFTNKARRAARTGNNPKLNFNIYRARPPEGEDK